MSKTLLCFHKINQNLEFILLINKLQQIHYSQICVLFSEMDSDRIDNFFSFTNKSSQ